MKRSSFLGITGAIAALAVGGYWYSRRNPRDTERSGHEVTIILGAEPITLDPSLMTEVFSATVANACHSPLVRVLPGGQVLWELASSIDLNPTATQATITLKSDARFWDTDMSPVTAEDVAFSLKRLQNSASPLKLVADRISTMKVESETVLKISFNSPEPEFVSLMAHLQAAILKKGSDQAPAKPLASHLIGAGAFAPGEFESGASYSFKRNPGFPGGGTVENLRFIVRADSQAQLAAVRSAEADVLRLRGSLLKEVLQEGSNDGTGMRPDFSSFTLTKAAASEVNVIIFNWASPTFARIPAENRKKMLASLSSALDRQGLAKVFGLSTPANSVIPDIAGGLAAPQIPSAPTTDWQGVGSFEIISSTDAAGREMASQASEFLAKAGAPCTTRQLDPTRLMEAIFGGKYDATVITFEMPVPGKLPWCLFWIPGPFSAFGKPMPELASEITTVRSTADNEMRQKAWGSLISNLDATQDVWLPLASRETVILHNNRLDGVTIDAAGTPFWSHLSWRK